MCFKELKGKILIKGKRLNKLDACFAQGAPLEVKTDLLTEEEDDEDDENKGEKKKSKVGLGTRYQRLTCETFGK